MKLMSEPNVLLLPRNCALSDQPRRGLTGSRARTVCSESSGYHTVVIVRGASSAENDYCRPHAPTVTPQSPKRALRLAATSTVRLLRSEEHTSELQSLLRSSYAVFCLKRKK